MQNIESENIKIENAMKQLQTDVSDLREIVDADRRELKIDFQQNILKACICCLAISLHSI